MLYRECHKIMIMNMKNRQNTIQYKHCIDSSIKPSINHKTQILKEIKQWRHELEGGSRRAWGSGFGVRQCCACAAHAPIKCLRYYARQGAGSQPRKLKDPGSDPDPDPDTVYDSLRKHRNLARQCRDPWWHLAAAAAAALSTRSRSRSIAWAWPRRQPRVEVQMACLTNDILMPVPFGDLFVFLLKWHLNERGFKSNPGTPPAFPLAICPNWSYEVMH